MSPLKATFLEGFTLPDICVEVVFECNLLLFVLSVIDALRIVPVFSPSSIVVIAVSVATVLFGTLIEFDLIFRTGLLVFVFSPLVTAAEASRVTGFVSMIPEDFFLVAFFASEESRNNSSNVARFSTLCLLSIITRLVGSANTNIAVDDRVVDKSGL